jgi:hypothetical protein
VELKMANHLFLLLDTSLALLEQFSQTLSATPVDQTSQSDSKSPSPLPLLSSSATVLKSQVTKLSLLAINPPFTPSAVVTVLSALNDSVLPSLVTASLLITPQTFTRAFHGEANVLVKTALRELTTLINGIKAIAINEGKNIDEKQKESLTGSTGRIWDSCDALVDISQKGIIAVVVKKTEQFRDTVKDAIRELEEWDPEDEDGDDGFGDLLGEDDDLDETPTGKDASEDDAARDIEGLQEQKKYALRIFKPISQIYSTIVANRLKKTTIASNPSAPSPYIHKINDLTSNLQEIPDIIDEAVGTLYDSDLKGTAKFVEDAKKRAVNALEISAFAWDKDAENPEKASEQTGDKFAEWARTWIRVVDEVGKSKES